MKRSPALILLAALGLVLLTARLGFWQLDRAAQKTEREAALSERRHLPPLLNDGLPRSSSETAAIVGRPARVTGRWQPMATVFLENRPLQGRAGFIVVTPLLLDDGTAVVVQRGWTPRDPIDRTRVSLPPTPDGVVSVSGRIAPPPARLYEFDAAASGAIRQNLDLDAFATESRLRLRPLSILQLESADAANDGLLREWPEPAADVHKHYGYAFQWFALSALTIALYAWFQIIRPRRQHAR